MAESTEKKEVNVKKYGFYAFTKDLSDGIGLIVFQEDSSTVEGVKLRIGGCEKFSMKRSKFEAILIYNLIEFVEILPKKAWKEYKTIYNK